MHEQLTEPSCLGGVVAIKSADSQTAESSLLKVWSTCQIHRFLLYDR